MNRTRLAQLAAVLGAAVLLVLAVGVTRTDLGTDSTTVAGPAMDPVGTEVSAEPGSAVGGDEPASAAGGDEPASAAGGDVPEPGQPDDTPVTGPTASAPADDATPGDPAAAPPNPDGDGTAGDLATASTDDQGPLPQEPRDPFAPGAAGGTSSGPSTATPPDDPAAEGPTGDDPASAGGSTAADPSPGGTTVGPADSQDAERSVSPPEVETSPAATYQVVLGDNLWDVAEAALGQGASDADVAVAVAQLYELNRDVIGADPDLILPGQVFELPGW